MFDKMKALLDMQKGMQEMKRQLDGITFEVLSPDRLVKITMNGSQEVQEVRVSDDIQTVDKALLEKCLKDTYNRAIQRSHDIAGQKMKDVVGFNFPGLT